MMRLLPVVSPCKHHGALGIMLHRNDQYHLCTGYSVQRWKGYGGNIQPIRQVLDQAM